MSTQRLTFGELSIGSHFIVWPIPGDNSGHGGYLGQQRLFVKTSMTTANNGRGMASTMNGTMDVIQVSLT